MGQDGTGTILSDPASCQENSRGCMDFLVGGWFRVEISMPTYII